MATFVATAVSCVINSVDLSDHITSCEVDDMFDESEFTNFGDSGNRTYKAGLRGGSIALEFQDDYASGKVDATLYAALGTIVTIVVKPTSAAVGSTNPTYSASYLISGYKPVTGKIGDPSKFTATWKRTGALTRATS